MIRPDRAPSVDDIARHYDELDVFYRDIWGEHVHHGLWRTGRESPQEAVLALIDLVAEAAAIVPGVRVCDVGCGYGGTARYLADRYGALLTGVTVSEAQLAFALKAGAGGDNPTYRRVDWLENDFAGESFDRVVSIECLEHISDKARFFSEILRVLTPGGRAAVTGWLVGPRSNRLTEEALVRPICREGHLPSLGTRDEYTGLARDAGLDVVDVRTLGPAVRRTWSLCARRLTRRVLTDRRYIGYLLDRRSSNRRFALTLVRMWLGYRVGALDYGLFVLRKPA